MEKSILDVVTGYAVNEGLESTVEQNGEYKRVQERMDSLTSEFDALGLTKERRAIW